MFFHCCMESMVVIRSLQQAIKFWTVRKVLSLWTSLTACFPVRTHFGKWICSHTQMSNVKTTVWNRNIRLSFLRTEYDIYYVIVTFQHVCYYILWDITLRWLVINSRLCRLAGYLYLHNSSRSVLLLLDYPEDGRSRLLRNVAKHPLINKASYTWRL